MYNPSAGFCRQPMIRIEDEGELEVVLARMFLRFLERKIGIGVRGGKAEAATAIFRRDPIHLRHVRIANRTIVQDEKNDGDLVGGPINFRRFLICASSSRQSSEQE